MLPLTDTSSGFIKVQDGKHPSLIFPIYHSAITYVNQNLQNVDFSDFR